MSEQSLQRTYRSVLRQFHKSAIKPRKERNQAISIQLRTLFEEERSRNKSGASRPSSNRNGSGDVGMGSGGGRNGFGFERQMIEMGEFMKAGRIYNELLLRYNPTHEMTSQEKTAAAARRVGMEEPVEYSAEEGDKKE